TGADPRAVRARAVVEGVNQPKRKTGDFIRPSDGEPLDPLMAWMLSQAGLEPSAYRSSAIQRRVSACLRRLRVNSADAARDLLTRQPEMLPFALNTMLIGVSEFFRDEAVFDYLKNSVLPDLLETRDGLRVCSFGVSGGQELYSVAMLLTECGALAQSTLQGIDCRADAIQRACEGVYGADDIAGVAPARRERFFQPSGGRWAVSPVLKKRIQWIVEDLFTGAADRECDLILFRNVAIYFNETHSAEAWRRLCSQLVPGGILVTGRAEKPPASLPLTRLAPSIYRKNLS
ncbi:MAG: CheR family methyltransferase, partial [Rariglobus sp.]